MKNIHVLQTDKLSRLTYTEQEVLVFNKNFETFNGVNINITSDEEIKDGDVATDGTVVGYYSLDDEGCPILKDSKCESGYSFSLAPHCKKIILTTDQDLIADGVQAIDDEFLEWFVNNPNCESVEVIHGLFNPMGRQVDPMNLGQNHSQCIWKYKIIIPRTSQQIIDEDFEGGLTMGQIPAKEDPKDVVLGYKTSIVPDLLKEELEPKTYWIGVVKWNDGTILRTEPFYKYDEGIKVWSSKFSYENKGKFQWIDYERFEEPKQHVNLISQNIEEFNENLENFKKLVSDETSPALKDFAKMFKNHCLECNKNFEECSCKEGYKESIKDIIISQTSEQTKQKAREYGDALVSKDPNVIQDWLNKYGNPEVTKQVEKEARELHEQSTIEDAIEKIYGVGYDGLSSKERVMRACNIAGFFDGAKWQAERMYDEKDMLEFISFVGKNYIKAKGFYYMKGDFEKKHKVSIHQILEQFKYVYIYKKQKK